MEWGIREVSSYIQMYHLIGVLMILEVLPISFMLYQFLKMQLNLPSCSIFEKSLKNKLKLCYWYWFKNIRTLLFGCLCVSQGKFPNAGCCGVWFCGLSIHFLCPYILLSHDHPDLVPAHFFNFFLFWLLLLFFGFHFSSLFLTTSDHLNNTFYFVLSVTSMI